MINFFDIIIFRILVKKFNLKIKLDFNILSMFYFYIIIQLMENLKNKQVY